MKNKQRNGSTLRLSQSIDTERVFDDSELLMISSRISVIVPVRDNEKGVFRFLDEFFAVTPYEFLPREIIVVDNLSKKPLILPRRFTEMAIVVRVETCMREGAGAARNAGVAHATGDWLLFCDSDCIPTRSTIAGFIRAQNGAVAYAGDVKAFRTSRISDFYDQQGTLLPHFKMVGDQRHPLYVVTANCLIERRAFDLAGGFNSIFLGAGGEDVELSKRLWEVGRVEFTADSVVFHDFGKGLGDFASRFYRYGRGNFQFQRLTNVTMKPRWKPPNKITLSNLFFMVLQYFSLRIGYGCEARRFKKYCGQSEIAG